MITGQQVGGARISGIGYYVPELVLSNFDFEKMVETSDEWIVTRSGIRERHIAADDQASSDMAIEAARKALKDARVKAENIDLIIVGTVTPDMPLPSTACIVQDKLGAKSASAFDVTAACSGFIYGITVAESMIATGKVERALVVGVETLSRILDFKDRKTCVLFGDGAGAAILEPCPRGEGILSTYMKSNGSYGELLYLPGGGSRSPLTEQRLKNRDRFVKMKGDGLFKYAVKSMVDAAHRALETADLTIDDVRYLIPHQANIRIIEGVRKRLKLSKEQVVVNIDRMGNTSSASIPIALGEIRERGILKKGDIIIMVAFGGGLTWGSVLFRN